MGLEKWLHCSRLQMEKERQNGGVDAMLKVADRKMCEGE